MNVRKESVGWSYVLVLLFTVIFIFTNVYMDLKESATTNKEMIQVKVASGETLKDISLKYNSEQNFTYVDFVEKVEDINNIEASSIQEGQTLLLPATK